MTITKLTNNVQPLDETNKINELVDGVNNAQPASTAVTSVNNVSPVNGNVTLNIPAAQVQADWTQTTSSATDYIKNKPNLAQVATSGSYNDLSNKPTIPSEVNETTVTNWGFTKNAGTVTSVNNVAPVNGNVTLTVSQTQADWSQTNTSAVGYIKNKPTSLSTTYHSGASWYRTYTDGWKEQGGNVTTGTGDRAWTQPTPTSDGTIGTGNFAVFCYSSSSNNYPYYALLNDNNTYWLLNSVWSGDYASWGFWNSTPLKLTQISWYQMNGSYRVQGYVIQGSNTTTTGQEDSRSTAGGTTWVNIYEGTNSNTSNGVTITASFSNTNYYKAYRILFKTVGNGISLSNVQLTAQEQYSLANTVAFLLPFTDTDYSYSLEFQSSGGGSAYVSSKTTTGMTISDTEAGSGSWIAMGY